jgi:hypothetical protein
VEEAETHHAARHNTTQQHADERQRKIVATKIQNDGFNTQRPTNDVCPFGTSLALYNSSDA